ncbi:TlpA family protein disulfide reductase [Sphingobium sp. H33]|uniref:TlpA family protein disulfide reductase n=2 Tax=Sphingobium nicotianae TaxID=2782607 RepID=A0A9X1D9D6_9SPHN|nr:TlpA disulfide reductase family protein [Sphingobium nicotianae]MBT2185466.1 TlpA family protein disulfide reductase [Sphingobium nicotianae]
MRSPFFALLVAIATTTTASASAKLSKSEPKIGELAPDIQLTLVSGEKVSIANLRGKVVILNYWATWCAPCKKELPTLDAYYQYFKDKGLQVYAVTTRDSQPLFTLKKLFAAMAIPAVRSIKSPYGNPEAVPTNIVIGRDGRIRYAAAGAFDLDALNEIIVPLLNERAPPTTSVAGSK